MGQCWEHEGKDSDTKTVTYIRKKEGKFWRSRILGGKTGCNSRRKTETNERKDR